MKRLNDSIRWRMVASNLTVIPAFKRYFGGPGSNYGLCHRLNSTFGRKVADRMKEQMWNAAAKGKLRGVNKRNAADRMGYLWPKFKRIIRIEACRKLSRMVKR